jgi:hypothetical protein
MQDYVGQKGYAVTINMIKLRPRAFYFSFDNTTVSRQVRSEFLLAHQQQCAPHIPSTKE